MARLYSIGRKITVQRKKPWEFTVRTDTDHLAAEFAELIGKPVETVTEEENTGDETSMPRPKNIGEIISGIRKQWKTRSGK